MVGHWGLAFQVTPKGGAPVQRARRRPGGRMSGSLPAAWLRLAAAAAALAAGAASVVVAILLVQRVLA